METKRDKNTIILVQPLMGILGEFVKHIPLSLLYVASGLVKNGFQVKIVDNRVNSDTWRKKLAVVLNDDVLFVGITVMSGPPVGNAIEVSKLVKKFGNIPVVWGGPHPTIASQQILSTDFVDFSISGSGVNSVIGLANNLSNAPMAKNFKDISGLGYKNSGTIHLNPRYRGFEHVYFKDIPYSLIEDFSPYGQIGSCERLFPIYSAYGCPYNCSFCVSPYLYKDFPQKWVPLPTKEIVDHMEYLHKRFNATEIYFYDDDSFVNLGHIGAVIKEVKRRSLKLKMSFRGVRINEVLKMDNQYLDDLAESGTNFLQIGLESGSQRILELFKKGVNVEDIISANKKLSGNKNIIITYNWIVGAPTETPEDLAKSTELILKLIDDNPRCVILRPNKFHPFLGTELAELALKHGYKQPSRLEEWVFEEAEGNKRQPWYTKKTEQIIKMLQVTSYFIDHKSTLLLRHRSIKNIFIKIMFFLYRPIARFRFKYGITFCLWEYSLYQFFVSRYRR